MSRPLWVIIGKSGNVRRNHSCAPRYVLCGALTFLHEAGNDFNVFANIFNAAELSSSDIVVEIGPGKGFLTKSILDKV